MFFKALRHFSPKKIKKERLLKKTESNAFCVLPFTHLATRPSGTLKTCCNASKSSLGSLERDDMKTLWNSNKMKQIRLDMLAGKKNSNCDRCFTEEKAIQSSKRTIENKRWKKFYGKDKITDILSDVSKDGSMPFHLRYFDFRPGTKCNLKCIICDPVNSSLWVKDYQKIYKKMKQSQLKQDIFIKAKANYVWHKDPVFKQQLYQQLKSLNTLYIAGGEPFIIKETYELLEACISKGYAKQISLRCNSNATRWRPDLFELLKHFKHVDFMCSFDDIGKRNNYIRYPSDWNKIESSLIEIDSKAPDNTNVFFDYTVQALNIYYVPEIIEWFLSKKFKTAVLEPHILHYPRQLNSKVLPPSLKSLVAQRYNELLLKLSEDKHKEIITQIRSFLNFMNDEDLSCQIPVLKEYLELLDHERNTSFNETFPELKEIFSKGVPCA